MSTEPMRVLVVDDQALVREGIASVLAPFDDIRVVGTVSDVDAAIQVCDDIGADVALLSSVPAGVEGTEAIGRLHHRQPALQVVVVTSHVDDVSVRALVEAGVNACLFPDVGVEELADAIRSVIGGRSVFSSDFVPQLLAGRVEDTPPAGLTARERDVLPLLASGMTNRAIAEELGLTAGTVRMYVSAILTKLGAANRTEASVVAIRERLIQGPENPPHTSGRSG